MIRCSWLEMQNGQQSFHFNKVPIPILFNYKAFVRGPTHESVFNTCIKTGSNCSLKNKELVVLGRAGFVVGFFVAFFFLFSLIQIHSHALENKPRRTYWDSERRGEYWHNLSSPSRKWPTLATFAAQE